LLEDRDQVHGQNRRLHPRNFPYMGIEPCIPADTAQEYRPDY
jgi:hypothetical protein